MGKLSFLAASTTAIALANAFCVDFNSADHCTGAVVGKFLGTTGSACQTSFTQSNSSQSIPASAGKSFNVVIQPQDNDKRTGVAFFGRENCEVLIGFGNVPVCTGVGAWSSFKVITIDEADDQLTNLDPAPILSISPNTTATASAGDQLPVPSEQSAAASGSGAASGTGSSNTTSTVVDTGVATGTGAVVPTSLARYAATTSTASTISEPVSSGISTATPLKKRGANSPELSKRIAHGSVQEHHGQLFRYHQVAARAWRGVPLDQWNEKIHKRVPRDHITSHAGRLHAREIGPVGGTGSDPHRRGITPRSLNELEKRAIPPSKCNLVRTCMIDSGDNDGFGISNAGNALLSAIKALNPAGDSWQFIEHPLVVEVTDNSGQVQGYIYAQTRQHSNVATCSDAGSEMDALTSAIEMGVSGSTVSDMRIDLKLLTGNGVTNTLFVTTRKIGNADMRIHPICEAIQLFD
ncbi:MAG: hypothetical protein L6R37_003645 [Teloschistes peruensis]|nr:MAG: hypothetical protein L6R37_003645 [Teloschistes peruensis]